MDSSNPSSTLYYTQYENVSEIMEPDEGIHGLDFSSLTSISEDDILYDSSSSTSQGNMSKDDFEYMAINNRDDLVKSGGQDSKTHNYSTIKDQVHTVAPLSINSDFKCTECSEVLLTSTALRKHLKDWHDTKLYQCRKCFKFFFNIADRQTHKNNFHHDTVNAIVNNNNFEPQYPPGTKFVMKRSESGYFKCPIEYCSFTTRIPGYWQNHINNVEHKGHNPHTKRKGRVSKS